MPDPRHRGRGDLLVQVHIEVPQEAHAASTRSCCANWPKSRTPTSRPSARASSSKLKEYFHAGEQCRDDTSDAEQTGAAAEGIRDRQAAAQVRSGGGRPDGSRSAGAEQGQADQQLDESEIRRLESLRDELKTAKDRALRCQAELENYRKRVAREMDDERRYANLPLLRDLLPVLDNVERAIEAAEKTPTPPACWRASRWSPSNSKTCSAAITARDRGPARALRSARAPCHHAAALGRASAEHGLDGHAERFQLHDRVVRPSQVIVAAEDVPHEPKNGRMNSQTLKKPRSTNPHEHAMPTYDYVCDACEHAFELFQSIKAEPSGSAPSAASRSSAG